MPIASPPFLAALIRLSFRRRVGNVFPGIEQPGAARDRLTRAASPLTGEPPHVNWRLSLRDGRHMIAASRGMQVDSGKE
jgi:hypothetical protein